MWVDPLVQFLGCPFLVLPVYPPCTPGQPLPFTPQSTPSLSSSNLPSPCTSKSTSSLYLCVYPSLHPQSTPSLSSSLSPPCPPSVYLFLVSPSLPLLVSSLLPPCTRSLPLPCPPPVYPLSYLRVYSLLVPPSLPSPCPPPVYLLLIPPSLAPLRTSQSTPFLSPPVYLLLEPLVYPLLVLLQSTPSSYPQSIPSSCLPVCSDEKTGSNPRSLTVGGPAQPDHTQRREEQETSDKNRVVGHSWHTDPGRRVYSHRGRGSVPDRVSSRVVQKQRAHTLSPVVGPLLPGPYKSGKGIDPELVIGHFPPFTGAKRAGSRPT